MVWLNTKRDEDIDLLSTIYTCTRITRLDILKPKSHKEIEIKKFWEAFLLTEYVETCISANRFSKKAFCDIRIVRSYRWFKVSPSSNNGFTERNSRLIFEGIGRILNHENCSHTLYDFLIFCKSIGAYPSCFWQKGSEDMPVDTNISLAKESLSKYVGTLGVFLQKTENLTFLDNKVSHKNNWLSAPSASKDLTISNADTSTASATKNFEFVRGDDKWLDPLNLESLPYFGRKSEMESLNFFIDHDDKFKIWAIEGPSGSGKTRLTFEWIYRQQEERLKNWNIRILNKQDRTNPKEWKEWKPTVNTLIVIDYLYSFDQVIENLIISCSKNSIFTVRLLVIDHVFEEPLHSDRRWGYSQDQSTLNQKEGLFFKIDSLLLTKTEDQSEIIRKIISHRSADTIDEDSLEEAVEYLKKKSDSNERALHPLFAALVGEAIRQHKDFTKWSRRELIAYYLSGSKRFPWEFCESSITGLWASYLVCAATIRRGISIKDCLASSKLCQHLPVDFEEVKLVAKKVVTSTENDKLPPFEPDILGESFFLIFLQKLEDSIIYTQDFFSIISSESNEDKIKDAHEFIAFIERLTRNLLNDNQNLSETQNYWRLLRSFLSVDNFSNDKIFSWSANISTVNAIKTILRYDEESKLNEWKSNIKSLDFYCGYNLFPQNNFEAIIDLTYAISKSNLNLNELLDLDTLKKALLNFRDIFSNNFHNKTDENIEFKEWKIFKDRSNDFISVVFNLIRKGEFEALKFLQIHYDNFLTWDWDRVYEDLAPLITLPIKSSNKQVFNALIQSNASLSLKDNRGRCPLIYAVELGCSWTVSYLLNLGLNIESTNDAGETPLLCACKFNHKEISKALINLGANPLVADNYGNTAIIYASKWSSTCLVKALLNKGANANNNNKKGYTPIIHAAKNNNVELVDLLLITNCNVNHRNSDNKTAIMYSLDNENLEILVRLINKGASIDTYLIRDSISIKNTKIIEILIRRLYKSDKESLNNKGLLSLAIEKNNSVAINELLKLDINLNEFSQNYKTPLITASRKNDINLVKTLIDKGADINFRGQDQDTILLDLIKRNVGNYTFASIDIMHHKPYPRLKSPMPINTKEPIYWYENLINFLLEKKIDANFRDRAGSTALIYAIGASDERIAKTLLIHGAYPNALNNLGDTALICAAKNPYSSKNLINLLLDHGSNINYRNLRKNTALIYACFNNNKEVVRTLLTNHANVNLQGDYELSPLMVAAKFGHLEIAEILVKFNADLNLENYCNETALKLSLDHNNISVANLLIHNGALIDPDDSPTEAFLKYDTSKWDEATSDLIIQLWLKEQNNPKIISSSLIKAITNNNTKAAISIIKLKTEINEKNDSGETALHISARLNYDKIVKALLTCGANPNSLNSFHRSPLLVATKENNTDVALELLRANASIDIPDRLGNTPIMLACMNLNLSLMIEFINRGANPNGVNLSGNAPLHIVIKSYIIGKINIPLDTLVLFIEILLASGADPEICNLKKETPVTLAVSHNLRPIEFKLRQIELFFSQNTTKPTIS